MSTEQKKPLFYLLTGFLAGAIITNLVTRIAYETNKAEDEWSEAWEHSSSPIEFGDAGKNLGPSESEPERSSDESTEE